MTWFSSRSMTYHIVHLEICQQMCQVYSIFNSPIDQISSNSKYLRKHSVEKFFVCLLEFNLFCQTILRQYQIDFSNVQFQLMMLMYFQISFFLTSHLLIWLFFLFLFCLLFLSFPLPFHCLFMVDPSMIILFQLLQVDRLWPLRTFSTIFKVLPAMANSISYDKISSFLNYLSNHQQHLLVALGAHWALHALTPPPLLRLQVSKQAYLSCAISFAWWFYSLPSAHYEASFALVYFQNGGRTH